MKVKSQFYILLGGGVRLYSYYGHRVELLHETGKVKNDHFRGQNFTSAKIILKMLFFGNFFVESKNFLCHVMAILIFQEQLYHIRGFEEEYSHPPRFAAPETFEMDFGNRWKALEELDRSQLGKFEII